MSTTDFKRILVGVDDSKDALLAFDYAIKYAKEQQAELVIRHWIRTISMVNMTN